MELSNIEHPAAVLLSENNACLRFFIHHRQNRKNR
jgi:hypothetical protein